MSIWANSDTRSIWQVEKPVYHDIGETLKSDIAKELKKIGLISTISFRTKEIDSILKKMIRKEKTYNELHDKIGLRIVVEFKEQLTIVDNLLLDKFSDIIVKREDMSEKLGENQFGYQSIHYDVLVSKDSKQYWGEIQLRTICQNTWSDLSHALAYKTEINVPSNIAREINALSAILELADNQFQHIQMMIGKLPDTNPIKILNFCEKLFYQYIGEFYDKEMTSYFLEGLDQIYENEIDPLILISNFTDDYMDVITERIANNESSIFFSQPEIFIILERLHSKKYRLMSYWEKIYHSSELELIANTWGVSIE